MPVTNRSTLLKPIRIPLQTGTHLTVNPVRMKLRLRLSVAGLSHDLMLCCSALFQCCPLIHNPRLLNPSPWWQLMTSCPDVLVIWESGGQLRHQWVTFVCVCAKTMHLIEHFKNSKSISFFFFFLEGDSLEVTHIFVLISHLQPNSSLSLEEESSRCNVSTVSIFFPFFVLCLQKTMRYPAYHMLRCHPRDRTTLCHRTRFPWQKASTV